MQREEDPDTEISRTLTELLSSFGVGPIARVATELGIFKSGASDGLESALRAYTLLIIDSPHPRAVAQCVARLTYLDEASGHPLRQEDIGRSIGVTKQAVCNMEAAIADKLNLPRRSSPKARLAHVLMNRRNYVHA
jgi:DNA-binding XRE family transcriptional regulator